MCHEMASPFPVGVGGEIDGVRLLGLLRHLGDDLLLVIHDQVLGPEAVVVDFDAHLSLGQVSHVPHGGDGDVAVAQEAAYRAGLCG